MEKYPKIAAANAKIAAEIAEHQKAIAAYHRLNKRIEDAWNAVKIKTRLNKINLVIPIMMDENQSGDILLSCDLQKRGVSEPFIGIEYGSIIGPKERFHCISKKTVLDTVVERNIVDSFISALDGVSDEIIDSIIAQHYLLGENNYKYPEITEIDA